jgi:fumarate reductase subunit C
MSGHTAFHPRWLRPRLSTYWWLGRWPYVRFILREISSVFVAWFVVFLLLFVRAIGRGSEAYRGFLEFAAHPMVLTINIVAMLFIVFHAYTWFAVAPQAIVAHLGKRRVPSRVVAGAHYIAWAVVSAAIFWLLFH